MTLDKWIPWNRHGMPERSLPGRPRQVGLEARRLSRNVPWRRGPHQPELVSLMDALHILAMLDRSQDMNLHRLTHDAELARDPCQVPNTIAPEPPIVNSSSMRYIKLCLPIMLLLACGCGPSRTRLGRYGEPRTRGGSRPCDCGRPRKTRQDQASLCGLPPSHHQFPGHAVRPISRGESQEAQSQSPTKAKKPKK